MASSDPFGRAIRDHHRGEQGEPLLQRDGESVLEHPIERFYFGTVDADTDDFVGWLDGRLDGPLLDLGAGAGRHALYFQERFETVALEVSEHLVELMGNRGVKDARIGDMFSLPDQFDRDRFRSVIAYGTQVQLAKSLDGVREFLTDLAHVTTPDATAVLHGYDPDLAATRDVLGFRPDPKPGNAYRVMHFEYEGDVGETLLFRLFSADRLREATVGTAWTVADLKHGPEDDPDQWLAALEK